MTANNFLSDEDKKRIGDINKILLEVASGNFLYEIERSDRDDELEGLVVGINMMIEELKASLISLRYFDLGQKNIVGMAFVIDDALNIRSINEGVTNTLSFNLPELQNKSLYDVVTSDSKRELEALRSRLASNGNYGTIELYFKTKGSFVVPTSCSISSLVEAEQKERRFLLLALETIVRKEDAEEEQRKGRQLENFDCTFRDAITDVRPEYIRECDFKRVQEAYSSIRNLLQTQWSLSLLAEKVGMEKRTLTKMFKKIYGKSVMAVLTDERMHTARKLLKNRDMRLKEIAYTVGYKSLTTFSLKFKKKFGCSPTEYRQQNLYD